MTFLSLVIVLLVVQWWGSGQPLQRDQWFYRWCQWLDDSAKQIPPLWRGALSVLAPCALLAVAVGTLVHYQQSLWLLLINVPVLLYSLGRGPFTDSLQQYIEASHADNSVRAAQILDELNLDPELRREREADDWVGLHREALRVFSYRGFERMFAVIFWFLVAGAPGALGYRLAVLLWSRWLEVNDGRASCLARAVTWVEWPAARLMGGAWALVGNFEGCVRPWRELWLQSIPTPVFLSRVLAGALGDTDDQGAPASHLSGATRIEPGFSLQLVEQLGAMFSRALLLWVFVAALVTLIL